MWGDALYNLGVYVYKNRKLSKNSYSVYYMHYAMF